MANLFKQVKIKVYDNLIKPVLESKSPVEEAAMGSLIGMFWGLTPTVGIQMWLVFMTWLVFKYTIKVRFDPVLGAALVWISNPLTMIPMYYGFLITGYWFFGLVGLTTQDMSYELFYQNFTAITSNPDLNTLEMAWQGFLFLIVDLGFPMVLGSLFYAIPFAILSYFVVLKGLKAHRMRTAAKAGMEYEAWRQIYEKSYGQKKEQPNQQSA